MSNQAALYLIRHVFLPPQLPQADDFTVKNETVLLHCVRDALVKFCDFVPKVSLGTVTAAVEMMEAMIRVHQLRGDDPAVDEDELLQMLHKLSRPGAMSTIPLNIGAQNAGVLITKVHNSAVRLEAFELSPTNEAAMATSGRLRRTFPGVGVTIHLGNFNQLGFKETLAETLATMSFQRAAGTQPCAKKAGKLHEESRDTTHPKMVTELLYAFLLAVGHPLDEARISKNTRDEVNWNNSLLPWRRSPTWLLVRVSLQLIFGRLAGPDDSLYKTFMAFVMAEILRNSLDDVVSSTLQSDLLLCMVAKLSRRLLKLTSGPVPAAVDHVREVMRQTNKLLSDRWSDIQKQDAPGLGKELKALEASDFGKDSTMHLPELDDFLASFARRGTQTAESHFSPSWTVALYDSSLLPSGVVVPDNAHLSLHLTAFETWVGKNLQTWFAGHKTTASTCSQLRDLIEDYHGKASTFYGGGKSNPESISIMLLTILELWIVCDRATIQIHPLLGKFDPEIPLGLFQNFLLTTRAHLERLHNAEAYLRERLENCEPSSSAPNIYTTCGSSGCFSVRYFDQSDKHQSLRSGIEERARKDRERKKDELRRLKDKYDNLMRMYHASSCEYYQGYNKKTGVPYTAHSSSCSRCSYHDRANSLKIEIHEWPLPNGLLALKSTVFELSVPEGFGSWREASIYFLFNVLKVCLGCERRPRSLYPLKGYQGLSRYFQSNVSSQHISLLSEDKPHMATHRRMVFVSTATESTVCVINGLHYACYDDRRSCFLTPFRPTDTIPKECTYKMPPASKHVQEYLFRPSPMPSGPPPNTVLASLHECPDDMTIEEFKAIASIPLGYNLQWRNIMIQLFSPSVDFNRRDTVLVIQQCIYQAGPPNGSAASRCAHGICEDEKFASRMVEGLLEATQRFEENWQSSSALTAFTALARRLLSLTPSSDIRQECLGFLSKARSVTFAWAQGLKSKAQESAVDADKLEFQRRALEAYLICADTFNIDERFQDAVFSDNASVSAFLQCSIAIQEGAQTVLASLDACLFGSLSAEIMPTPVPGMRFSLKRRHAGYLVHLGLTHGSGRTGPDFLVQAARGDCNYELVPKRCLRGSLPTKFVEDYVHWWDYTGECVEFRDNNAPWLLATSHWRLVMAHCGTKWQLVRDDSTLVDVRSPSAQLFSTIFRPLEDPYWIHIVRRKSDSSVAVELPRARLEFSYAPQQPSILSRQYRGMSVDPGQFVGTLVGLKDKLVLRDDQPRHPAVPARRKVLVLEGGVSFAKTKDHVQVCISKGDAPRVHAYEVDDRLARLVSNESRQSNLFLGYLHALTSFAIPDPLTERTGTEQALTILSSASVKSFDVLTGENINLLSKVAQLTPGRKFYPANERVMQTVAWDSRLGFLAQHGLFLGHVQSIFEQAERSKFFHPGSYISPPDPELNQVDSHLLQRDSLRSSTFRVSGFGAESFSLRHDAPYAARDPAGSSESSQAFKIANSTSVSGSDCDLPTEQVTYDADLLSTHSSLHFITSNWIGLQRSLRTAVNKHHLMMWLATLAFAQNTDTAVLQTLASSQTSQHVAGVSAPEGDLFDLRNGCTFDAARMCAFLEGRCVPFDESPEQYLHQEPNESDYDFMRRQEKDYQANLSRAVDALLGVLRSQWPCKAPKIPPSHYEKYHWDTYVRVREALPGIQALFKTWYDNLQFKAYIREIVRSLPSQITPPTLKESLMATPDPALSSRPRFISEDALFESCRPPSIVAEPRIFDLETVHKHQRRDYRLPSLLSRLSKKTVGEYQERYIQDLASSSDALQRRQLTESRSDSPDDDLKSRLCSYLQAWRDHTQKRLGLIMDTLFDPPATGPARCATHIFDFYQRPRLSVSSLLQRLNHVHLKNTPVAWRDCLIQFGLALSQLQRAERMVASLGDPIALENELRNPGHTNWSPGDYPDTLLLEVESSIMVREVQEGIAEKMRRPPGNENAVMQLNMGEGKSSVIVPMVAAALADGSCLVRVIVAKPQSKQMLQMMVSKLGGLLNRRIFHMPFSRAVRVGTSEATAIQAIFQDCMNCRGILLVQPEHILSFQLMAIETAISGKASVSQSLVRAKNFLGRVSRDIVDESDENFSVKFELVYTMGTQRPVEYSPDRWVCIHQVLEVVRKFLAEVQRAHPDSIEVSAHHNGCFPRTRILQESARDMLLSLVARHLSRAGSKGLPMAIQSSHVQDAVFTYIYKTDLSKSEIDAVETSELWSSSTKDAILLLRGLISSQILSFVFCQKRWRVDYGPDHNRRPSTRLAVPYRAKDNPSARSEFSHPDVIIILTSLSYYYGGLDDSEIFMSFEHLTRSDQADMEYGYWVKDSHNLPVAFQQLTGINLEDRQQCIEQVFPCIRFSKGTIDYFLQHIVFPKEMKEFPHKLSASGWDIGARKVNAITGFSGTNDSRAFLPLSVKQLDLPEQKPTNALVLEYLLQNENSVALMPAVKGSDKSVAETLLEMVVRLDPPARVILDVGAQILELDNLGVAKRWLQMMDDHETTQAVIFCDEDDHICVVDRRGRVESFQTSPFSNQTDVCLVFLDEAHTRGTDLKLPGGYRAAVTLGANLTKDRLVQACMRMRKLGKGQSVVFCVPDEIQQKITARSQDSGDTAITVAHILEWSISETFADLQRGIWLWANQGRRYQRHEVLWDEARVDAEETELGQTQAEEFLEEEAQTIEVRYRPGHQLDTSQISLDNEHCADAITQRLRQFGGLKLESTTFREEQERELSPEVEQEREVQKPPHATPAQHAIHPDVRAFISKGTVAKGSPAFLFAFQALSDTSAAQYYDVAKFPPSLLVTADFTRTIIPVGRGHTSDLFQRPVQWILTTASSAGVVEQAVIISPYEAQELLPEIRVSRCVSLHLYAPRPNIGYRPLDTLRLYTTPHQPVPRVMPELFTNELNLFSGQLYMKSMNEYLSVRRFLGLRSADQKDSESGLSGSSTNVMDTETPNLIKFLRILTTKIRRNCESIDKTHLGRILDHRTLEDSDFTNSMDIG
ncbi:hypothetical protein CSHISOI_04936, partial [Colletotrichum shisoi]